MIHGTTLLRHCFLCNKYFSYKNFGKRLCFLLTKNFVAIDKKKHPLSTHERCTIVQQIRSPEKHQGVALENDIHIDVKNDDSNCSYVVLTVRLDFDSVCWLQIDDKKMNPTITKTNPFVYKLPWTTESEYNIAITCESTGKEYKIVLQGKTLTPDKFDFDFAFDSVLHTEQASISNTLFLHLQQDIVQCRTKHKLDGSAEIQVLNLQSKDEVALQEARTTLCEYALLHNETVSTQCSES